MLQEMVLEVGVALRAFPVARLHQTFVIIILVLEHYLSVERCLVKFLPFMNCPLAHCIYFAANRALH